MSVPSEIRAAGGIVYCAPAGILYVLLIQDKYGVWTLPKGHLEAGESEVEAAAREIHEETGIAATITTLVQHVQYPVCKKGVWRDKQVAYFLATAEHAEPQPRHDEGITAARWMKPDEAIPLIGYAQVREVLRRGLALIKRDRA